MNKKRREQLVNALTMIERASMIVSAAQDAEDNAIDNYPENFQGTDRYERMEEISEALSEADDKLYDAKDQIRSAIESLTEAENLIQSAIKK